MPPLNVINSFSQNKIFIYLLKVDWAWPNYIYPLKICFMAHSGKLLIIINMTK